MSASSILRGGQPVASPPGTAQATGVADLAVRLAPVCVDVVDVDEIAARIEAAGINDRVAAQRFGYPSVFRLADAVLTHLHRDYGHQLTRRAARAVRAPAPAPYAGHALLRSALYLTPLLLAVAADQALDRISWQGPAAVIVLGWATSQLLGYLGHVVRAHRGPGPATRLLALGFLGVAAVWCVALAAAPVAWLDAHHLTTMYAVTLTELGLFAAVTTALVTGSEAGLLRWLLPSGVLATLMVLGWWPHLLPIPDDLLLVALLLPALGWVFRHLRTPATGDGGAVGRLAGADLRPASAYMAIGLAQATAFVIVWRVAPTGAASVPALAPLVAAVPLLELFIGWHTRSHTAILQHLDDYDDDPRPLRRLRWATVAIMTGPLAVGGALTLGAYRTAAWSDQDSRHLVLAMAAGVLLAGVYAVVLLLATRRLLGPAAALASAPVLGVLGQTRHAHTLDLSTSLLPTTVANLAAVLTVGLAVAGWLLAGREEQR